MQVAHLGLAVVLAAIIVAGKSSPASADGSQASPEWRVEAGWLVRDATVQADDGFAANICIAKHGPVLNAAAPARIETRAASYGGFQTIYTTGNGEAWRLPYLRMVSTPSGRCLCFSGNEKSCQPLPGQAPALAQPGQNAPSLPKKRFQLREHLVGGGAAAHGAHVMQFLGLFDHLVETGIFVYQQPDVAEGPVAESHAQNALDVVGPAREQSAHVRHHARMVSDRHFQHRAR